MKKRRLDFAAKRTVTAIVPGSEPRVPEAIVKVLAR